MSPPTLLRSRRHVAYILDFNMKPLFIIVVWAIFSVGNIALAEWNDTIRRNRIKEGNPKQIEHFWWGLAYCICCGAVFYISRNWWQFFSLLLLHLSIFPVSYNLFAGQPTFALSKTSKAITDRWMVKLGFKSTEEVNIISFCISLIFLMLQLYKV